MTAEARGTQNTGRELTLKNLSVRVAIALVLACLGGVVAAQALSFWVTRHWVDPRMYVLLGVGTIVHDPDSLRFAFPVRADSVLHTRGALSALGKRVGLGTRLDVLVYDFAVGGTPRRVFSTPMDRPTGESLVGWDQDGIHLRYGDRHGYRSIVIDPDKGTTTLLPESVSNAMTHDLIRARQQLVPGRDYPDVKMDSLRFVVTDPATNKRRVLFEYEREYGGIAVERFDDWNLEKSGTPRGRSQ